MKHRKQHPFRGFSFHQSSVAAVALALFVLLTMSAAQAQTFQVLHAFQNGQDGSGPTAGLTMDRGGRLYGTTAGGNFIYEGSAFKMTESGSAWVLAPLYDFSYGRGLAPGALTIGPDGAFYGVTFVGGSHRQCDEGDGCGTVFKLQPPPRACASFLCPWTQTVLYDFQGAGDGYQPVGNVVFDSAGNLYGITLYGGTGFCSGIGCGTVFKLSPSGGSWTKTVLYNFTQGDDGYYPVGGLWMDAAGNLYGTADGGSGTKGVIYELTPGSPFWTQTVLHSFQGSDGTYAEGPLIPDAAGNLYGVTAGGGANDSGTVFELTQPGTWNFESLFSFPHYPAGDQPMGPLAIDSAGNLYGTTSAGGANEVGTLFKLALVNGSWVETDLHDFSSTDGEPPNGGIVIDANGNLYGTSSMGGSTTNCYVGCGTVWEFTP